MIKSFFLTPVFVYTLVGGSWAWAEITPQKIVSEFQHQKENLLQAETKQRKVLSSIFNINKKIKRLEIERSQLANKKFVLESASLENQNKIHQLADTLKEQKNLLRRRLGLVFQMSDNSLPKILFSSSSSADLERNLKILTVITQQDLLLMKRYHQNQIDLIREEAKLKRRLADLEKISTNIAIKEKSLSFEQSNKNRILESIKKNQNLTLAKIEALKNKSKNIDDDLYDLLTQPSFFDQKGKLPMPIAGRLTQDFGLIKNQDYGVYFNNKGVVLKTSNILVKAVFSGRVAFAGQIDGFGTTVIIDHGDHYYSVYSNLDQIKVKEGDQVQQLDSIANLNINENHLYFEIRHFSEPYDPKLWLKWSST